MSTKKDFQMAAKLLATKIRGGFGWAPDSHTARTQVEDLLCEIFAEQNPRFDAERFRAAVGKALGE